MQLSAQVNTFGRHMQQKYGYRVHKLALNASFTCPNRDGTKGLGGCTFCNNSSFAPNAKQPPTVASQIEAGRQVIRKRTGANHYLAYFQAYTNTYADINYLKELYDDALCEPDVIGLSVGTRPDCVPDPVLDLLASYQEQGHEVWLELGLQSANDHSLERVNRGHGWDEYQDAIERARLRELQVCTHLIVGLPGETAMDSVASFDRVMELGQASTATQGMKLHPLHVVKGTQLARQWNRGEFTTLGFDDYIEACVEIIRRSPPELVYHRLTGTAEPEILLAPGWCAKKWLVLNAISAALDGQPYPGFDDERLICCA
ncbi:TIGR01212 family radical SAM protein [Motiliproteus coralliicola]|uniref:TIGR01212 family radical SAM protein n=1 Tax=Motiliproteus coralliicola TaxID=2283196 RepID=A0A369WCT1_9GAMM|nr:TIGR01212 family radical SAM protein [Motiliproteus coralliicola]RDE19437.1 TIGR01212 family radical SAM protein [Motiliproteus coralliicola]